MNLQPAMTNAFKAAEEDCFSGLEKTKNICNHEYAATPDIDINRTKFFCLKCGDTRYGGFDLSYQTKF